MIPDIITEYVDSDLNVLGEYSILDVIMNMTKEHLIDSLQNSFLRFPFQNIFNDEKMRTNFMFGHGKMNVEKAVNIFLKEIGGIENFDAIKKQYFEIKKIEQHIKGIEDCQKQVATSTLYTGPNRLNNFDMIYGFTNGEYMDSTEIDEYLEYEDEMEEDEKFTFPYIIGTKEEKFELHPETVLHYIKSYIVDKDITGKSLYFNMVINSLISDMLNNKIYDILLDDDTSIEGIRCKKQLARFISYFVKHDYCKSDGTVETEGLEKLKTFIKIWNSKQNLKFYFLNPKEIVAVKPETTKQDIELYLQNQLNDLNNEKQKQLNQVENIINNSNLTSSLKM